MNKKRKIYVGLVLILVMGLLFAGCGGDKEKPLVEQTAVERLNGKIIGIEPGAGIMTKSEIAIEEYGLSEYTLMDGSTPVMTALLAEAIENEEWIVVTGWDPHWKFAMWDLKYLEDPKGVFGEAEQIHTIVRKDLEEDMPEVYAFLDNFNWTPDDMNNLMVANLDEESDEYQNAVNWMEENADKVAKWIPEDMGAEKGKVKMAFSPWDSEIASNNLVKAVLQEKMGYEVELLEVDLGAMYQGISVGEIDALVAAWLPTTQGHYVEEIKDDIIDLGPNLDGTKIGWVVPTYMTIDSIEDLQ